MLPEDTGMRQIEITAHFVSDYRTLCSFLPHSFYRTFFTAHFDSGYRTFWSILPHKKNVLLWLYNPGSRQTMRSDRAATRDASL